MSVRVTHIIKVILVAGAERHLLTLLPALRERDVQPSIILLSEPDKPMNDYIEMARERRIPVERVVIRGHIDLTLPPRLRLALDRQQPDIVHTHLLHADVYGVPLARLHGARVVTSRHNDNAFRRRVPLRLLHRVLWRATDAGIGISDAIRQFCIDVEGAPTAKMHTIHYGIDSVQADRDACRAALRAALNLPPDAVIVGTMSRLIEQKGLTFALKAFARLNTDAHLVICGEGVLRDDLEAEADALGVQAHFLGWHPEPTEILAAYDVLLMPSLWEGFGLVMLEAMAQGVPIIGSHVSAIPEVIADGETGLLVPPRDVDALSAAIETLVADQPKREQMGLAARQRLVDHFSADRMADETLKIYQNLS